MHNLKKWMCTLQNSNNSQKNQNLKVPILSSAEIKKLWRGELKDSAIYQYSPGHCNTVEAFEEIGKHIYLDGWSGKEMILLSYNLTPPPDRSKLYKNKAFCPNLAGQQKSYFALFKVVADLINLKTIRYDNLLSEGAWHAIHQDYKEVSNLLKEAQERALKICDKLAYWLKVGDVQSFYRTSGTAGDTPISKEDWNIDSPKRVFKSLTVSSLTGPSSTEATDSFLFFSIKDIKLVLQGFTTEFRNTGFTGSYQSEYMKAMDILIARAKITTINQPTITDLQQHAKAALIECGLKPSKTSVHKLSSFVRLKERQNGGRRPQQ